MTGNEMIKLLKAHGFTLDRVAGSHHILVNGALTVSVPVHGKKELGKGLELRILKDAGIR